MPRSSIPLSLEYILLGFLQEHPAHGYELYKILASPRGAALVWRVKQARFYALLKNQDVNNDCCY